MRMHALALLVPLLLCPNGSALAQPTTARPAPDQTQARLKALEDRIITLERKIGDQDSASSKIGTDLQNRVAVLEDQRNLRRGS